SDWTAVHGPALERACALVVICTPGLWADQGKHDWVHLELDWWLRHRTTPPIIVDTTGEGERWIPSKIKKRWPNAQRVNLVQDLWENAPEPEHAQIRIQVVEQILGGISDSRFETIKQDQALARRKSRLLAVLS